MVTETRAEVLVVGDEALIAVQGELDLFTLHVLESALADAPTVSHVVVDLQAVDFVDCAALRLIEERARVYAAEGRTLRVERASGLVRRLIEILRLDDLRVR